VCACCQGVCSPEVYMQGAFGDHAAWHFMCSSSSSSGGGGGWQLPWWLFAQACTQGGWVFSVPAAEAQLLLAAWGACGRFQGFSTLRLVCWFWCMIPTAVCYVRLVQRAYPHVQGGAFFLRDCFIPSCSWFPTAGCAYVMQGPWPFCTATAFVCPTTTPSPIPIRLPPLPVTW